MTSEQIKFNLRAAKDLLEQVAAEPIYLELDDPDDHLKVAVQHIDDVLYDPQLEKQQ